MGSKGMIFRDLTIRRKLALLTLTSSVFAVTLACVGFAIYERQRFHADIENELATLADTREQTRRPLWPSTTLRPRGKCWRSYALKTMVRRIPVLPARDLSRVSPRRPGSNFATPIVEA